jgi:4-oxalocrotonate tautomerase
MEGRTEEMKSKLIREVTAAMSRTLQAPKERIRVVIYEVPTSNWGIGGDTAASLGR